MTHDESRPQQDSAAQQVTSVASPSDRADFVHDFLYWGLKKFGTGRRDSFGHLVFVAARDFGRADPDLADEIIEKAVSERRYAKPLHRLLRGTRWSERPREALRAVADDGYYTVLKDAELGSRISTQKNAHNFLRAYRDDLGSERGLTDRERRLFEAIVSSAMAALLVAGIAATSSTAAAAVEATRRGASTAKLLTLFVLAGLAGFFVHVTCRLSGNTDGAGDAFISSSELDDREAVGGAVTSDAGLAEKCTSLRPFERRRCLVSEAGVADTWGEHARAVKLYETALATRYADTDLTASDLASIPRLTVYAQGASSGLWQLDTEDIWDRLASSHWRANEKRAAVEVYEKVVASCESSARCETRQCTLLRLLKHDIGDDLGAGRVCGGAPSFDYRRFYADGLIAEATNDDALALIGFARELAHLPAPTVASVASAALARWTDVYPEVPRVPPDTHERFERALARMKMEHRVVRQGRVFAFATTSDSGVILWVVLNLPSYAADCWNSGEDMPPFHFDYIRPAGGTHPVNINSMPLISTWLANTQRDVSFRATVRFSMESGACTPFEEDVDVCVVGGVIHARAECPRTLE